MSAVSYHEGIRLLLWKRCLCIVVSSCLLLGCPTMAASSHHNTVSTAKFLLSETLPSEYILVRGGGNGRNHNDYYDDEEYDDELYDDYDDEEDEDEYERHLEEDRRSRSRRPQPPPSSQQQQRRRPPPPSSYGRGGRRPPPPSRRKPKPSMTSNMVSSVSSLAKSSLDVTTSATVASIKGTGKAAYYLASPKHVSRRDIVGVWRLDQDALSTSCAANVELTMPGDVLVTYQGDEWKTPYYFAEHSWPRSCTIHFEARAFQGPQDKTPVNMYYVASFRRKIADRNVIKMVGKIYQITHSKGKFPFASNKSQKTLVGSFTARKRFTPPPPRKSKQQKQQQQRGGPKKRGRGPPPPSQISSARRTNQHKFDDESEYDNEYDNYDPYDDYYD